MRPCSLREYVQPFLEIGHRHVTIKILDGKAVAEHVWIRDDVE